MRLLDEVDLNIFIKFQIIYIMPCLSFSKLKPASISALTSLFLQSQQLELNQQITQ
jgi:hypothetical protein